MLKGMSAAIGKRGRTNGKEEEYGKRARRKIPRKYRIRIVAGEVRFAIRSLPVCG